MKAQDLKIEELIEFREGNIHLHGRRLVMHDIHALAQFRKDLLDTMGPEHARRILTRFGFYWGQADAAGMSRIFKWDSTQEWLLAGPRMHTLQGVTHSEVKTCSLDENKQTLDMQVIWHDCSEAKQHLLEIGTSATAACWIQTGYASGYASYCCNQPIFFVEQTCRACGDAECTSIGRDKASWGEAITPYLAYYSEVETFHSKISQLSDALKKQNQLLASQSPLPHSQATQGHFAEIRSESFGKVLDMAERVARFDSSILITGPSGSGKEVLARHIHRQSDRSQGLFLAINCGALPETLLESELFGHKTGSFTGATSDRIGLFEQSHGGTLFLDEIGDISQSLQVKLLRVLQEREVMRVGESHTRKIDVRVMAATNRNLTLAIQQGRFREDLFYRLSVIEMEVPPLKQRKDDILPLARHFIKKLSKTLNLPKLRLDATCLDFLLDYAWPGNVRELENILERAAILSRDQTLMPECLPRNILQFKQSETTFTTDATKTLAEMERNHIGAVLTSTQGNRTRAAAILGINPTTLWRKLK